MQDSEFYWYDANYAIAHERPSSLINEAIHYVNIET
jgi:hypothetical protein